MGLAFPGVAGHLVQRQDGVVGRVVGVMAGRAIDGLAALGHGQVIGDRDRFVMRDQKAVLRPGGRRPGPHPRARAGAHEVDGAIGAEIVVSSFRRHLLFMRAPAEFGGLQPLRHEAFDAPGVDEGPHGLRRLGALRIAFGDVDALDAERHGEPPPFLARRRLRRLMADRRRDVEQRLFDEPGHHAGVGAAGGDGGRPTGATAAQVHERFAQGVVRAL